MEQTYIMLKPDALQRGLVGEILRRIEQKGYRIAAAKTMTLNEAILRVHYAHLTAQSFFPSLVEYMTSGPVLALIVQGENAVAGMRAIIGPTKFEQAAGGTIRGDFANSTTRNLIHGSDSPEAAREEIQRFFGETPHIFSGNNA